MVLNDITTALVSILLTTGGALIANILWDSINRPQVSVLRLKNDSTGEYTRYSAVVFNDGRDVAKNCRGEFFLIGKDEEYYYRILLPLGWINQSTRSDVFPTRSDSKDIYPKQKAEVYLGHSHIGFAEINIIPTSASISDETKTNDISRAELTTRHLCKINHHGSLTNINTYIDDLRDPDALIPYYDPEFEILLDTSEEVKFTFSEFNNISWEKAEIIVRPENTTPIRSRIDIQNGNLSQQPVFTKSDRSVLKLLNSNYGP